MTVGIILATYNGERYIKEQLDSIRNQTYSDFCCYIHDDGSKDNTLSICKEYEKKYPKMFKILEYPCTGGAKNNFFSLLKRVSEDYIFFCDQDDYWEKDKIELCIKKLVSCSGPMLVFSDLNIVDEKLDTISASYFKMAHFVPKRLTFENSLIKGYIPGCAMAVNRVLYQKILEYRNVDKIKMHDWWVFASAYGMGAEIICIEKPLVKYRQHSNNTLGLEDNSTHARIKTNIGRLLSGQLYNVKKNYVNSIVAQAEELNNMSYISKKNKRFLEKYILVQKKNKLHRILFYLINFRGVYRVWWTAVWA